MPDQSGAPMTRFLRSNWIIIMIGLLLTMSTLLTMGNNDVIERNYELQKQTELVRQRTLEILSRTMHGLDLGVRGFALTKDDNMLIPYREAEQTNHITFDQLDSLLTTQGYEKREELNDVEAEVLKYIQFSKNMVQIARMDSMRQFAMMLKEDRGYAVWKKYSDFSTPLLRYEDHLNNKALLNYKAAIRNNIILQMFILGLSIPLLYFFIMKIRRERDGREEVLNKVKENDKKFVFDPGNVNGSMSNDNSIKNVQKALHFIYQLADGNFDVNWDGLTEDNYKLNKTTLAGNLLLLRDRLKIVKLEDERRNWLNEGLTSFSEMVRSHQHDIKLLTEHCVSYLTRYLKAQQAGLFILEEKETHKYLTLAGCYAFNRKKFIEKRIEIGQGLIGQTYLEGDAVRLKEIPPGYTAITSGLGEATPSHLVIVPFKYNTKSPAIIEMASFYEFEDHHILFLERAGEHLASAIINSQTTSKMKSLLEKASKTEAEMLNREEELRQNMEELQATQEELLRKESELNNPGR
jgi:CHASE3 domain sensor protein